MCLLSDIPRHLPHIVPMVGHCAFAGVTTCFLFLLHHCEYLSNVRVSSLSVHTSTVLQQVQLAHGPCILSSFASLRAYGGVAFLLFCYLKPRPHHLHLSIGWLISWNGIYILGLSALRNLICFWGFIFVSFLFFKFLPAFFHILFFLTENREKIFMAVAS